MQYYITLLEYSTISLCQNKNLVMNLIFWLISTQNVSLTYLLNVWDLVYFEFKG